MEKKVDVLEIVRRVVSALLAAAVFPAAYFMEFIYTQVSTGLIESAAMEWNITLKRVVDIVTGRDSISKILGFGDEAKEAFKWPSALDPVENLIIAFIICFAIVLVIALFLVFWSALSRNRYVPIVGAFLGIVAVFVMKHFFNQIAAPFIDGTISLLKLFSDGVIVSLIGNIVKIGIDVLVLGTFRNAILICFFGILLWNLLFILVELGDEEAAKEKENRAKMKANKKHSKKRKA